MARFPRSLRFQVLCLGVAATLTAATVGEAAPQPPDETGKPAAQKSVQKPARKKVRTRKSAGRPAADMPEGESAASATASASASGELKFSKDIAPILVGNCVGCHNATQKRKNFDLSTFEKLMEGTPDEKVIVPGKPEESHLVLRIKGLETPKMPQGGNRTLTAAAIEKIERWVKAGALLDAGMDRTALISKYAASPEDLRKADLARMSTAEREKAVEAAGLERWKKVSPKTTPEFHAGPHFVMFGTLPKARAAAALRAVEPQYNALKALLGPGPLEWGEKASIYVFNDVATYNEFVRLIETREVEAGETATARFNVPQPYVAVVDPFGGRDEPAGSGSGSAGKRARGKASDDAATSDRSLAAVVTEPLTSGVLARAGKPPKWLALGLGTSLASKLEPRNPYYARVRRDAYDLAEQGWISKASDALGDNTKAGDLRAVGLAVVEWFNATDRAVLPAFVKGMLAGGDKLDDVMLKVLNGSREEFLNSTGTFVIGQYGAGR